MPHLSRPSRLRMGQTTLENILVIAFAGAGFLYLGQMLFHAWASSSGFISGVLAAGLP